MGISTNLQPNLRDGTLFAIFCSKILSYLLRNILHNLFDVLFCTCTYAKLLYTSQQKTNFLVQIHGRGQVVNRVQKIYSMSKYYSSYYNTFKPKQFINIYQFLT